MFGRYFLMICKVNGGMYYIDSINNLFMFFGRVLKHELDNWIIKIGVQEHPFDIQEHPFFWDVCRLVECSMAFSKDLRDKVNVLTLSK